MVAHHSSLDTVRGVVCNARLKLIGYCSHPLPSHGDRWSRPRSRSKSRQDELAVGNSRCCFSPRRPRAQGHRTHKLRPRLEETYQTLECKFCFIVVPAELGRSWPFLLGPLFTHAIGCGYRRNNLPRLCCCALRYDSWSGRTSKIWRS
jgi:hypothetical protein